MAPKSKITITVDAPSDTEVHVTVSPGQVAEDSGAGTSTDVRAKGGSKGKSKSQVDGEHSKDGKMDHDDSLSEGDWEEVKAEPSPSSPIPPSDSPPEPHPPSHSPPDAQELPESRYKITRKAGERVHRESCRMLKHHGEHQVILPSLCQTCMPAGFLSQETRVGFSFEFPSHLHIVGEHSRPSCIPRCDKILKPCRQCIFIP